MSQLTLRSFGEWTRFPSFCFLLVSLQVLLRQLIDRVAQRQNRSSATFFTIHQCMRRYSAFSAAVISSWVCLSLFKPTSSVQASAGVNSPVTRGHDEPNESSTCETRFEQEATSPPDHTLDMTLFLASRALDAVVVHQWRSRPRCSGRWRFLRAVSRYADSGLFAIGSGTVMWNWFYSPDRLPREYTKWISRAAQVDDRLILALRSARAGKWVYGQDSGKEAAILQSMCKDYGWPEKWGDPIVTIPIPCEMVHMGIGPNCHWHAVVRFARTFRFAMATNLPLQLFVRIVTRRRVSLRTLEGVLVDSARSSAFLGAFVALMYYGICFSRSVAGPVLLGSDVASSQYWDSGMCVRVACALCGASVLLEKPGRRSELALFVAPRALATSLPRSCKSQYAWVEKAVLTLSISTLMSLNNVESRPIRGVFGRLLHQVL